MSVRHKQVVSVSLDEIYSLLQPPESMRRTDNCQRFILQPALAQINAVTSLAVSYETLKEGRKIVGFMFNIKTKTKKAVKKEKKPAAAVEFSSRLEIELFKQLQQVRPAVTQEEVLQQAKLEGVSVIQMLEFLKKQQELL
jgi:plasmid replication initiation protein